MRLAVGAAISNKPCFSTFLVYLAWQNVIYAEFRNCGRLGLFDEIPKFTDAVLRRATLRHAKRSALLEPRWCGAGTCISSLNPLRLMVTELRFRESKE